jgi:hypothetical protein
MSELSYLEEYCNISDQAYSDFVTAIGREPTEDELEYEVESLMDRYR